MHLVVKAHSFKCVAPERNLEPRVEFDGQRSAGVQHGGDGVNEGRQGRQGQETQ